MISESTLQQIQSGKFNTKFKAGGHYTPVEVTVKEQRMFFNFRFDRALLDEVKTTFGDRKWHGYESPPIKLWSAPITFRNLFRLEAIQGKYGPNPYRFWDNYTDHTEKILKFCAERTKPVVPYKHQIQMVNDGLNAHWWIDAAEMGTGKTLAALLIAEMVGLTPIIWVGPNSALIAARTEILKWQSPLIMDIMTYDGLRKLVKEWPADKIPPRIIVLDESSLAKTPQAQRTKAAQFIADTMRYKYGFDCYVILLSGTPAPKTPSDWWSQCEIACPGFIREANIYAFRERLGHMTKEESAAGGFYNKLKTWRDSESICHHCGEIEGHPNHRDVNFIDTLGQTANFETHDFVKGSNEVTKLSKRMKGLVSVFLKEDCLDLPAKRYELHELEPSQELLNAAQMIVRTTTRAADAYIKLRTLSDGFLYKEVGTGKMRECPGCEGRKTITEYIDRDDPDAVLLQEEIEGQYRIQWSEPPMDVDLLEYVPQIIGKRKIEIVGRDHDCAVCSGTGVVEITERTMDKVPCPKLDLLTTLHERHAECGRLNVYAGFQGSIDRIVKRAQRQGWAVIQADGRGWKGWDGQGNPIDEPSEKLVHFYQERQDLFPRMQFTGQAGAAGMGLTLTAAPSTFFYSNDHNPQNRQQAEDRGHRIGMDTERGGLIIDNIHLPSDRKVLESLRKSRNLQRMSMTGLKELYNV
jgi:hypothetical protein